MTTAIVVSESQYLGSLELLGALWAGEYVPSIGGRSPLASYLRVVRGEERAA
jgi:hypothetical protein